MANKHTEIVRFLNLGQVCYYCEVPFWSNGPQTAKTVEHLIPLSRGGNKAYSNKVAACYHCNHTKGNMTEGEFWEWLRRGRPRKKDYLREIGLAPVSPQADS